MAEPADVPRKTFTGYLSLENKRGWNVNSWE